jgi:FkbM family methyltransferase
MRCVRSAPERLAIAFPMKLPNPVTTYLQAVQARRSLNIRGLPLIPKSVWSSAPFYRTGFNQFILWLDALHLDGVKRIVDVGACHGDFSQAAEAMFPDAQFLLVEPSTHLHEELRRRCAERRGRWQLATCALSAASGIASLHIDPNQEGIGSLATFSDEYLRANPAASPTEQLECPVRTLDELCAEQEIASIDVLKIDVEGFEFEVLEGARSMLRNTRAVVIELSLVRRPDSADALERMLSFLRLANFHVVDILPAYHDPTHSWLPIEFNVLARQIR